MLWDGRVIYGESPIGIKIEHHLPDSLQWKIQLWTLKDCLDFCSEELTGDTSALTIQDIEPLMFKKLSPALNVTYNLHPRKDMTPKSKKETDQERWLDECISGSLTKDPSLYPINEPNKNILHHCRVH